METVPHNPEEQADVLTPEDLRDLNTAMLDAAGAADVLHRLEGLDDQERYAQSLRLGDILKRAAETDDLATLDQLTGDVARLGLAEVSDRYADPVLAGPELRPRVIADPARPESAAANRQFGKAALEMMRQKRPELIQRDFEESLRRAGQPLEGVSVTPADRLRQAVARTLAEGRLNGESTDEGFKPRNDLADRLGYEVIKAEAQRLELDPAKLMREAVAEKKRLEESFRELRAEAARRTAEDAKRREQKARQKINEAEAAEQRLNLGDDEQAVQYAADEAYAADFEASFLARDPELAQLSRQIDRENNPTVKRELERQAKEYVDAIKALNLDQRSAQLVGEVKQATTRREFSEHQVSREDPLAEVQAAANRDRLQANVRAFPDRHVGGWWHRKAGRGPRITESFFTSPGNHRLIVAERRADKTGELISQTVFTLEDETKDLGRGRLAPPRGFNVHMEKVRAHDKSASGYRPTVMDYWPGGAGWSGWRSEQGGTLIGRKPKEQRGGFWFWLLRGGGA